MNARLPPFTRTRFAKSHLSVRNGLARITRVVTGADFFCRGKRSALLIGQQARRTKTSMPPYHEATGFCFPGNKRFGFRDSLWAVVKPRMDTARPLAMLWFRDPRLKKTRPTCLCAGRTFSASARHMTVHMPVVSIGFNGGGERGPQAWRPCGLPPGRKPATPKSPCPFRSAARP